MYGIEVWDKYAFLAVADRLEIIDLSDPLKPACVARHQSGVYKSGVAVSGNFAYLSDRSWGLEVLQFSPAIELSSNNGNARLNLFGETGQNYALESKSALLSTSFWESFQTNRLLTNGQTFLEINGTEFSARFFRARMLP
jgi:hypothetical protein